MIRAAPLLLLVTIVLWPARGAAARLEEVSPGPSVGTTIDGFNQVMGPSATEPEHAGIFVNPRPVPCPSCPPVVAPPANAPPANPRATGPSASARR
jgi:hypothetical protein